MTIKRMCLIGITFQLITLLKWIFEVNEIKQFTYSSYRYPEARAIQRKIIFHSGPTNSGKTYHAIQKYLSAKSGVYCGPLKLLAHEIFEKSNAAVSVLPNICSFSC